jgi:hypothetical protein
MTPTVRMCAICGGRFCRLDLDWRQGPLGRRLCSDCLDALTAGRRPDGAHVRETADAVPTTCMETIP